MQLLLSLFVLKSQRLSQCVVCDAVVTCADVWYLAPLVCVFFLILIPVWVVIARRSPQIKEVLRSGWQPVIVAMSISRYTNTHTHRVQLSVYTAVMRIPPVVNALV